MKKRWLPAILAFLLLSAACSGAVPAQGADGRVQETQPTTETEELAMDAVKESEKVIYLAGGCFWGIEKLMQSIPGVLDAESGYANGSGGEDADYCSGRI